MNNKSLELAGAWSGLAYVLFFGLGWLILARFLPPISPAATASEVATLFQERHLSLMLASVIMMVSTLILIPFSAVLLLVIQKIEGRTGMLTLMLGFSLALGLVLNFYTPLSWATAAFRPERSPELILLMSDIGFLQFMGGIPLFILTWAVIAYATLVVTPRDNPVLPRWFGYLNLWTVVLYIPELLIYFFKTGPFAWDGIVGFWIPALLFTAYFLAATYVLLPAVKKHL